jgi:hypothetical protein
MFQHFSFILLEHRLELAKRSGRLDTQQNCTISASFLRLPRFSLSSSKFAVLPSPPGGEGQERWLSAFQYFSFSPLGLSVTGRFQHVSLSSLPS